VSVSQIMIMKSSIFVVESLPKRSPQLSSDLQRSLDISVSYLPTSRPCVLLMSSPDNASVLLTCEVKQKNGIRETKALGKN